MTGNEDAIAGLLLGAISVMATVIGVLYSKKEKDKKEHKEEQNSQEVQHKRELQMLRDEMQRKVDSFNDLLFKSKDEKAEDYAELLEKYMATMKSYEQIVLNSGRKYNDKLIDQINQNHKEIATMIIEMNAKLK